MNCSAIPRSHSLGEKEVPRYMQRSSASSSSSSSGAGEGLPSIRNLLHSIEQERSSPISAHRSSSLSHAALEESSTASSYSRTPAPMVSHLPGSSRFKSLGSREHHLSRSSHSWDLKATLRSMSPQKRPPLAPSAYAHSHYYAPTRPSVPLDDAKQSAQRPMVSFADVREAPRESHGHHEYSRSLPAMPKSFRDGSSNLHFSAAWQQYPSYESTVEPATSSVSSRRRHTLSAFQEPQLERTSDHELTSTPRAIHGGTHLSPGIIPESPTTPTRGNMAFSAPRYARTRQHVKSGSDGPADHRLYMHSSASTSGSMPSLSTSELSSSPSKHRIRKHSLEEGMFSKPTSLWTAPMSHSASASSPHSSVWHSRSSTLDSIETSSSLGSIRSSAAARSSISSVHSRGTEAPRTPTHKRPDYNRDWRFPLDRSRHESQSGIGSANAGSMIPPSPFANMSLSSPQKSAAHSVPYDRPRAQTIGFPDRPIAPLPSHSVVNQASSAHPTRSLSSHSFGSLPHRVSSLDIDGRSGASISYLENGPRPPSNTMIVSAKNVGGSAGSNKYTCTWCGKRFSRPSSLKIHYHSHTGEKPFTCDEPGCGRNFSVQSNLRRHQKSHQVGSDRPPASTSHATPKTSAGHDSLNQSPEGTPLRTSLDSASFRPREMQQGNWNEKQAMPQVSLFYEPRERKPSPSSSAAEDLEDDDAFMTEEDESSERKSHRKIRRSSSDHVVYEDTLSGDETMHDV